MPSYEQLRNASQRRIRQGRLGRQYQQLVQMLREDSGADGESHGSLLDVVRRNIERGNGIRHFSDESSKNLNVYFRSGSKYKLDTIRITIEGVEYLYTLEDGRGPGGGGGDYEWMDASDPKSRLRKWIRHRGISLYKKFSKGKSHIVKTVTPFGTRKKKRKGLTKDQQEQKLAYIIGRKISNLGTKKYIDEEHVDVYSEAVRDWIASESSKIAEMFPEMAANIFRTIIIDGK